MSREMKVEIVALILYCLVIIRMDQRKGLLTAAQCLRKYASTMRDAGNWCYVRAIRAENYARELVEP